jgi:hypothetical protein
MIPFGMDPYDAFKLKVAEMERTSEHARYRKLSRESKSEKAGGPRINWGSRMFSVVKSHFHLGRQHSGARESLGARCADC